MGNGLALSCVRPSTGLGIGLGDAAPVSGRPGFASWRAGTIWAMSRLRRVNCSGPGKPPAARSRLRVPGRGGQKVSDAEILDRIAELRIPPAWEDCGSARAVRSHPGHRRRRRRRKQYLYHERWRQRRDQEKFDEMIEFARALPLMRGEWTAAARGRDGARARARVRRATARPRLLPRGRRGLCGGERELRAGDDQARHVTLKAATDRVRLPGEERQAPRPVAGRSGGPRDRAGFKRRRGGGDELLAYRGGGAGATSARPTSTTT